MSSGNSKYDHDFAVKLHDAMADAAHIVKLAIAYEGRPVAYAYIPPEEYEDSCIMCAGTSDKGVLLWVEYSYATRKWTMGVYNLERNFFHDTSEHYTDEGEVLWNVLWDATYFLEHPKLLPLRSVTTI